MPTAQSQPRDAALDAAAADGRALRAALGETASWRAPAEALARNAGGSDAGFARTLFEVQRAFAIFPPGSPAGDSLFRLAEALPRIPDRPSRIAMLADRVPALRGWKAAAALPFASVAMNAIGRQFVYAETVAAALRRAERDVRASAASALLLRHAGGGRAHRRRRRSAIFGAIWTQSAAMERAAGARAGVWRERLEVSVKLSPFTPLRRSELRAGSRSAARSPEANLRPRRRGRVSGLRSTPRDRKACPFSSICSRRWRRIRPSTLGRAGPCGAGVSAAGAADVEALLEIAGGRRKRGGMPIAVRLVKGAYWDAEVKRRKSWALRAIRYSPTSGSPTCRISPAPGGSRPDWTSVYPQFATHNPVTLACVLALSDRFDGASAAPARFELPAPARNGRSAARRTRSYASASAGAHVCTVGERRRKKKLAFRGA